MKFRRRWIPALVVVVVLVSLCAAGYHALYRGAPDLAACASADRPPRIRPDYADTVIPPNVAPLNFRVAEPGDGYRVTIRAEQGESIEVRSATPDIVIPPDRWRALLQANRGHALYVDVYVRANDGRWTRFTPITNTIAEDDIDGYLVYRRIYPGYNQWRRVGIYQRDLGGHEESVVLSGDSFHEFPAESRVRTSGCVNCHTFCNNRTAKMTVGIRDETYGSSVLLALDGRAVKVDTKFGYTAWHPSGRIVAYSLNKVRQFFHDSGAEVRDVVDLDGALAYYVVESQTLKSNPKIADKDRLETYPTWSPDGTYLYFCSAPIPWADRNKVPPKNYDKVRYDLIRIRYDVETDTWGDRETVLPAERTGKSILLPRISPDGKYLLFCMCDYGCFPIYQPGSDLYIMDLAAAERTGRFEYRRLDINSERSESWHSWSSNSRWIAFSSKRRDGLFTRSYLSHVDADGRVDKPLILPQEDPGFYDSCLYTYSVPELIVEPVRTRQEDLARAVRSTQGVAVTMPLTGASPKVPPPPGGAAWHPERE